MQRPLFVLASIVAWAVACNAILGNEERVLSELGDDASNEPRDTGPDTDNPCHADLQSDPKNCSACGHDCLWGTCNSGKCQPFTLVTGQTQPTFLLVRDGVAYWANQGGTVHGCAVAGCNGQAKRITGIDAGNPQPSGLDVMDASVYVLGAYSEAIDTCPTAGCVAPTRIASGINLPEDLRVDAKGIFFLSSSDGYVGRCARPTCAGGPARVASSTSPQVWHDLASDDTTMYWVAGPNNQFDKAMIYRALKTQTDGGPEQIAANVAFPNALFAHEGFLYVNQRGTTISRIALTTGFPRTDLTTVEKNAYGLAVDDTHAYWLSGATGAVRRCPLQDCSAKVETIADRQNDPRGPVVTDSAIYWTEFAGGTVKGIAK